LIRNRDKKVTEVWIRWHHQLVLLASGPEDRHYMLNHTTGQLQFGDGQNGRIPPAGAQIRAARFRAGGGRVGNVAAEQINQQLSSIGGVEKLFNPVAAEGGADAETIESVAQRGPFTVRHQGRAISAIDYETMAYEASAAVAVAHAQPLRDNGRIRRPGRLTLTIIPWSEAERPWPTFGLRQRVLRYIAAHAPADLVAADKIMVTGPNYQPVNVTAVLTPQSAENAGIVDQAVRAALRQFFHPLFGGPDGTGWKPGQTVYLSDVAARLGHVPGIDAIQSISMTSQAILQSERVRILEDHIAVIGDIQLQIKV
jgi:predicted phage baseplate assembly protein